MRRKSEPHGSHLLLKQTPRCPPRIEFMMTSNEMHLAVSRWLVHPPMVKVRWPQVRALCARQKGPCPEALKLKELQSPQATNTIQLAVLFNFI